MRFSLFAAGGNVSATPVVNTRQLFTRLLPLLGIDVICDIGSMDGSDALRFGRRMPAARVLAFEANPRNFELMNANAELFARGVRVEPMAVCDADGAADFFVVRAGAADHARRGMSSLHRRRETDQLEATVRVETTRLDSYLERCDLDPGRLALWIDVEGKAFEVIEGARGVFAAIQLLHVEVETRPLIGTNQKTYREVGALLAAAGFTELATDFVSSGSQFNVLYLCAALPAATRAAVRQALRRAVWRRRFSNLVYPLLPGRVRGYLAGRFRIRSGIA